ncbi:endonuclease [Sterolibacterium denitrificans]|uniref:Very short patch repair endonuclease n=1 Tax=Sterolibacterium denitrificans TaxID=157592 RepID=A0A656ZD19_9PROT|nr:DNA mismatch endonuclease Vsr [Sterolibacterium denitrificans]KYC29615.1 endonuclease [Sterolibacterium denitrificans]
MDIFSPDQRSRLMSRIRGKDTKPELLVRRAVHALGFRFRLHRRDLPGSPDLVFPSRHKVIFVHGCYWHRHPGCQYAYTPKSNMAFWQLKFDANVTRDRLALSTLESLGWGVLVIWECETHDAEALRARLIEFLRGDEASEEGSHGKQ